MIAVIALLAAAAPVSPSVADAERAFAAMAQKDGQWTAFRATAAPDGVMFVPAMVKAQDWLKGKADPPESVKWAPARTLTSCDGTLAVSTGGWTNNGGKAHGVFTTVWKATPDGWRWLLDQGHDTPKLLTVPAAPKEARASCSGLPAAGGERTEVQPADDVVVQRDNAMPDGDLRSLPQGADEDWPLIASGQSTDGTLRWESHGDAKTGRRSFAVYRWNGTLFELARVELNLP